MVFRTTFLSVFLMLSLAKVANSFPVQTNWTQRMNMLNGQTNHQTIAQADEEAESIILELGLTDDQIAQLNQVDRQFSPQLKELYPAWDITQEELETLIRSEDASESEVRAKYEELEAIDQQLSDLQFERRMAIREILRPEQRLPYEQYIDQRISESGF